MIGFVCALVVFVEPMANIATVATIPILTENFRSVLIALLFILFFSISLESLFTLLSLS